MKFVMCFQPKVMHDNVMVKFHLTLRWSFGNLFKTFMVDHVNQGFKAVTSRVDNQPIKQPIKQRYKYTVLTLRIS